MFLVKKLLNNILLIFRGKFMILENKKLVFVHAPRTSGTSIEKAILNGLVQDSMKHLKASQYKKMIGNLQWESYYKFSIVRNPWDRVISMYHQKYFQDIGIRSGKSLKYFLSNYTPAPWEHGIQCSDYIDEKLNLIIKYENRVEGLNLLYEQTGIFVDSNISERSDNRTDKDYKKFYDSETIEIVKNMFYNDIQNFNYDF